MLLPIIGIIIIILAVLALAYAYLNYYMFHHTLDGSNSLYSKMKERMKKSFWIGIGLGIIGAVCLVLNMIV